MAPARKAAKPARPARKTAATKPKKVPPKKAAKRLTKAAPKAAKATKPAKAAKRAPAKQAPKAKPKATLPPEGDAWIFVKGEEEDPWLKPPTEAWEVVDPRQAPAAGAVPSAARPVKPASQAWPSAPPSAPPVPSSAAAPKPAFDTTTGAWLSAEAPPAPMPPDTPPEASKRGPGPTFWTVILALDLVFLGLNALASIVAGLVLVFAPDSQAADTFRDAVHIDSPAALLEETLLTFTLFGVVPLLWVWFTRVRPAEGTRRYLHLHSPGPALARGVLLTIPLLLAVAVLSGAYTVATQGWDGLTHPSEDANPAVQGILDNLSWPLAVLIALCAGLGEEIFFRGLLQRWIGVWGQAILFGLAHAAGGYPPQILFALGLGVLFGTLVKRGWSLWTMVAAHALYDFTLLAIGLASR